MLKEVEGLGHVVRELAPTAMWLSGTDVPQAQPVLVERIKDGIAEQVDCTPHDVGGW